MHRNDNFFIPKRFPPWRMAGSIPHCSLETMHCRELHLLFVSCQIAIHTLKKSCFRFKWNNLGLSIISIGLRMGIWDTLNWRQWFIVVRGRKFLVSLICTISGVLIVLHFRCTCYLIPDLIIQHWFSHHYVITPSYCVWIQLLFHSLGSELL